MNMSDNLEEAGDGPHSQAAAGSPFPPQQDSPNALHICVRWIPLPFGLCLLGIAILLALLQCYVFGNGVLTWSTLSSRSSLLMGVLGLAAITILFTYCRISVVNGWVIVQKVVLLGHPARHWTVREVKRVVGPSQSWQDVQSPTSAECLSASSSGFLTRFSSALSRLVWGLREESSIMAGSRPGGLVLLFHNGDVHGSLRAHPNRLLDDWARQINRALDEQRQVDMDAGFLRLHGTPPRGLTVTENGDEVTMQLGRPRFFASFGYLLAALGMMVTGGAAWSLGAAQKNWIAGAGFSLAGVFGAFLLVETILTLCRRYRVRLRRESLEIVSEGLLLTRSYHWEKDELDQLDAGEHRLTRFDRFVFPCLLVKTVSGKKQKLMPLYDEVRLFWLIAKIRSHLQMQPKPYMSESDMHTERIKRGIALAVGCVAILALGLFPWQRQVQPEPDYVHFVFGQLKYLQPKGSVPGMRMTRPAGWKVRYDRKFPDRAAELLDERGIPWIDLHLGAGQPPNTEEPLAVVVSPYDQVKVFRSESFDQTDRRQEVQYRLFFGIHGLTITIHADDEETLKPVILEMAKTIDYIGP